MSQPFPVVVEQLADGQYRLSWSSDFSSGPVRVRAHAMAEQVPAADPLLEGVLGEAHVDLDAAVRHYFHLEPESGQPLIAAQRDVPLEGGTNFRDMGGYRAAEGRRVRWGRLYRSGHSAGFTERDRERVEALDIAVCCDFRRDEERAIEVARLPERTRVVPLPIDPGSITSFFGEVGKGNAAPEDVARFMEYINREFVLHHTAHYRRMFEELLALEGRPFLINCAAGKDRTGFGAALILAALGVSEADIVHDYLLSQQYYPYQREIARIRRKYGPQLGENFEIERIMPLMQTRESYIRAALDTIHEQTGDIETYLEQALGIGPAERTTLRALYTTE